MISLLILATLWQGVFTFVLIQLNAVDIENSACHQTSLSEHTPLNTTQTDTTNDKQDDCDKSCRGFCHCNYCGCIGLISSFLSIHFSSIVLNNNAFPTFLDEPSAQLFKPPRTFRS